MRDTPHRPPDSPVIAVIGDVMLDRYWSCRFSPQPQSGPARLDLDGERLQPGGAANVAMSLAALGARVTLFGLVGEDAEADRLEELLRDAGIDCRLRRVAAHPTIVKLRIAESGQPLLRIDHERPFPEPEARRLANTCLEAFGDRPPAALVLSDYVKGSLAGPAPLIEAARAAGIPVVADTKSPDWQPFRGVTCLTPNREEFVRVAGPCDDDETLARRASALAASRIGDALLVTLGGYGMLLARAGEPTEWYGNRVPSEDPAIGAGDTAVALLAARLAAGEALPEAARHACRRTADAVRRSAGATVCIESGGGIDPATGDGEVEILRAIDRARAEGERLVFTNGCFDLLHPGHLASLREARAEGDRLIVAINDDASVRHNKGPGRPAQPLADRIEALRAIDAVDWVIPFSEPTPERLIRAITPDVLAKGGDYAGCPIAGADWVCDHGGRVVITGYLEGFSTTAILAAERAPRAPGGTE